MLDKKETRRLEEAEKRLREVVGVEPISLIVALLTEPGEFSLSDSDFLFDEYERLEKQIGVWREWTGVFAHPSLESHSSPQGSLKGRSSLEERRREKRAAHDGIAAQATEDLLRFLACHDIAAVLFRRERLGAHALSAAKVPMWIEAQAQQDRKEEIRRLEETLWRIREAVGVEPTSIMVALLAGYNESDLPSEDSLRDEYHRLDGRIGVWKEWTDDSIQPALETKSGSSAAERRRAEIFANEGNPVHAIEALLRFLASRDLATAVFRREHLGNQLLSPSEVVAWIEARAVGEEDSAGAEDDSIQAEVGSNSNVDGRSVAERVSHLPGGRLAYRGGVLHDGTEITTSLEPRPGGVLDQLYSVATGDAYVSLGWSCSVAVDFILGGVVHQPSSVEVLEVRREPAAPVLSRIVLSIDPATPPEHVKAEYARLRSNFKGAEETRKSQIKQRRLAEATVGFEILTAVLEDIYNRAEPIGLETLLADNDDGSDEALSDAEWLRAMGNLHEFFEVPKLYVKQAKVRHKKRGSKTSSASDHGEVPDDQKPAGHSKRETALVLRKLLKKKHFEEPLKKWNVEPTSWKCTDAAKFRENCVSAMEKLLRIDYLEGFNRRLLR